MKGEITLQLNDTSPYELEKFEEIFRILIEKGALSGVKGGKTIIHFDGNGEFMGISFEYWPYRKRKT